MSTLTRFVGLDLQSLRPSGRAFLLSLVILLFAAIAPSRSAYAVIPALVAFALLFVPQYLFGNDERGRMDTLYGALGIGRGQVVAGRYATGLISVVLAAALGVLATPLVALLLRVSFQWQTALILGVVSLVAVGIMLAVELPVYFALGASRARSVGIAIPALLVGIVVMLAAVFPPAAEGLMSVFGSLPVSLLVVVGVIVFVVVSAVSLRIATGLYRRRDL